MQQTLSKPEYRPNLKECEGHLSCWRCRFFRIGHNSFSPMVLYRTCLLHFDYHMYFDIQTELREEVYDPNGRGFTEADECKDYLCFQKACKTFVWKNIR